MDTVNAGSFLYPLALQVPGPLHIVDWLIRSTIEQFPFWPAWQSSAKVVLQYVHGQNNRDAMSAVVRREMQASSPRSQLLESLKKTTGRFAHWRWRTLSKAVKDLDIVESVITAVFCIVEKGDRDIKIRDAAVLTKLQQVARDKELWNQARAIAFAIKFLMILMGWLQGCHCHEEELKEGKTVHCNMKGCRAKGFAAYLRSLIQDIHHERDSLAPGAFGTVPVEFVRDALLHQVANLEVKFHWVFQPPYTIWQASVYISWCIV